MKKIVFALLITIAMASSVWADAILINGAGATFPYPIYSKWFDEYAKMNPGVMINYQSIGSGGGGDCPRFFLPPLEISSGTTRFCSRLPRCLYKSSPTRFLLPTASNNACALRVRAP